MTEAQAAEFRSKYVIADFEDEGHKTYEEYKRIKKSIK